MQRRAFLRITLPLALAGRTAAAPKDDPELTFGVIADPQYADQEPMGSRHYRQSLGKLTASIEELNQHPLKFVVTLGDIIDKGFESFAAIMPLYEKLRAPRHFVVGNHDFDVADADKSKVLGALGMDRAYYRIDHGKWTFLYLDGAEIAIWRHAEKDPRTKEALALLKKSQADGVRSAKPWNAAISSKQFDWLKGELEQSRKNGQRVIIFNHYPVIPAEDPHNLWNAKEVVALLDQYDHIAAYMNGHNHKGNYASHQGCHYVNFKGMVETNDKSAYGVVRCFADRLEIDGFGTEPDRQLS